VSRSDDPYARLRRRQARQRERQDRAGFDPSPPTDDDWTVEEEDTDGLRRLRAPTAVGDTLAGVLQRRGWGERLHAATLAGRWSDLVGPQLAERCEPVRLAGGCLVVRAESQAWATQLRYLHAQLLTNANELLGSARVREVRIVFGPLERGRGSSGDHRRAGGPG
jgi:predicted nucleic acid-binding Zn ribbon protein